MEKPKQVIEGFELFKGLCRLRVNALECLFCEFGERCASLRVENGKTVLAAGFFAVGDDQLPHQVVERASEIMERVSNMPNDLPRKWVRVNEPIGVCERFGILLVSDAKVPFRKEVANSSVEFVDVIVRPVCFEPNPVKYLVLPVLFMDWETFKVVRPQFKFRGGVMPTSCAHPGANQAQNGLLVCMLGLC
jgi:hypothetical protein